MGIGCAGYAGGTMITKGDRVLYTLTAKDAEQVNRRRTSGESIAARMKDSVSVDVEIGKEHEPRATIYGWPRGAQAHIGNAVKEGQMFPGVVVEDWAEIDGPNPNLQVWLDGTDALWVTSVPEGDGPGTFTRARNAAQGGPFSALDKRESARYQREVIDARRLPTNF